jgi:hypothetical protein
VAGAVGTLWYMSTADDLPLVVLLILFAFVGGVPILAYRALPTGRTRLRGDG